ncbi:hypothetical protein N8563_00410 [bacterium]|jgi:nickel transport protein|nr:hypothetical protein [bacterium]
MTVFSHRLLATCTAIGLGFMAGQQAQAHGIESSLRYLNGQLELSTSFSTGEPVEGATVRLLNADGTPGDELGEIGANGQLVLTLPNLVEGVLDLQVDGGPGHRDYLELPIRQGSVLLDEVVQKPNQRPLLPHLAWLGAPTLLGLVSLMVKVRPASLNR